MMIDEANQTAKKPISSNRYINTMNGGAIYLP